MLLKHLIFCGLCCNHLLNVQTLYHVLRDLIVRPYYDIIRVLAGEDHEDTLMQGKDRVVATFVVVDDVITPDTHIEKITK